MIGTLEAKGLAYRADDGDVNYAVRKFPGYGKLSGKSLDELRAGERVDVDAGKHDPLDFVLWKRAKPGEPAWAVAVGRGPAGLAHRVLGDVRARCSASTSTSTAAAQDLQFPHHENEIAQSEGAHRRTVRQLLDAQRLRARRQREDVEVARQLLHHPRGAREATTPRSCASSSLRAHYRSPLNYSDQHLDDARSALTRLYTALKAHDGAAAATIDWSEPHAARFRDAMDDDFDTPEAVAVLFELASEVNRTPVARRGRAAQGAGRHAGPAAARSDGVPAGGARRRCDGRRERIEALIAARAAARKAKNFAEADRIRKELLTAGIRSKTGRKGTIWRRS